MQTTRAILEREINATWDIIMDKAAAKQSTFESQTTGRQSMLQQIFLARVKSEPFDQLYPQVFVVEIME